MLAYILPLLIISQASNAYSTPNSYSRAWTCRATTTNNGESEVTNMEIFGCYKPGKVYMTVSSSNLSRQLIEGECKHLGDQVNDTIKIDIHPGHANGFTLTMEPGTTKRKVLIASNTIDQRKRTAICYKK